MSKICFVLGTRPEIIKMSPVIRQCQKQNIDFFIVHTGQHYSFEMDKLIFEDLELPQPKYNLEVGSGTHAVQTAAILTKTEAILVEEKPSVVLVQGDTNSVLSGALAAIKLHIRVGHIEAGLRSFDRKMPEEINRIIVDHIANYLFAPTETAKTNLLNEGIDQKNILVTGNTIVDAVNLGLQLAQSKSKILVDLNIQKDKYLLLTLHRAENVDDFSTFNEILKGLASLQSYNLPIIWPIHPRTKSRLQEFNLLKTLETNKTFKIIDPVGFIDLIQLQANAKLVITDSGGLQEESCILGTPCVTVRTTTERPESVDVGANYLAGVTEEGIKQGVTEMIRKSKKWSNPFGDGLAAENIISACLSTSK